MTTPIDLTQLLAIRDAIRGLAERRGLSTVAERGLRRKAVADFLSGNSAAWAIATASKSTRPVRPNGPEAAA
jgi:hypothetical protein